MYSLIFSILKTFGPYIIFALVEAAALLWAYNQGLKPGQKIQEQQSIASQVLIDEANAKIADGEKTKAISAKIIGEQLDNETKINDDLAESNSTLLNARLRVIPSPSDCSPVPDSSTTGYRVGKGIAKGWILPESMAKGFITDAKLADDTVAQCRAMQETIRTNCELFGNCK